MTTHQQETWIATMVLAISEHHASLSATDCETPQCQRLVRLRVIKNTSLPGFVDLQLDPYLYTGDLKVIPVEFWRTLLQRRSGTASLAWSLSDGKILLHNFLLQPTQAELNQGVEEILTEADAFFTALKHAGLLAQTELVQFSPNPPLTLNGSQLGE